MEYENVASATELSSAGCRDEGFEPWSTEVKFSKQKEIRTLAGLRICYQSWLGIECLVKTFNRGEDEKVDVDEINELLEENNNEKPSI